jgi:hypothetical protein
LFVLMSSRGNSDLAVYDAALRKESKGVKIGGGASGILINAEAGRAFIACAPPNSVAVLDLNSPASDRPH